MTNKNFQKSKELYEKALNSISGGVNSPVRSFKNVGGTPIFFESGKGAYLYDVDNNQFIDYVASWGPMILGHSPEVTQQCIQEQTKKALSFGAPTDIEIELAEKIILAFLQSANQGIELIQYHPDQETVSVMSDIFTTIKDDIKKLTKTDEEAYAFNPQPGLKTHQLVDHVLDELKGWDIFHMAGWEDWMPKPKDAEKVLEQFRSDVYQTFTNHWFKDLPEEKQQEWIDWVGGDL